MDGAILGNMIGSQFLYEGNYCKDFKLFTEDCMITGNVWMAMAVSAALKGADNDESRIEDALYMALTVYGVNYPANPDFGYSMDSEYDTRSDCSALITAAVGENTKDINECVRIARKVAEIAFIPEKHVKACEALTAAIFLAGHGSSKTDIARYIQDNYYNLDFVLMDYVFEREYDDKCESIVALAIKAFLVSTSFEDAVRTAASLGDELDTLVAMTGELAEAFYHIPKSLNDQSKPYFEEIVKNHLACHLGECPI